MTTFRTKGVGPTNFPMKLEYSVIYLIIAILSGVVGFGVVAGTAATIAKLCFVVFLIVFLLSLVGPRTRW